MPNHFHCSHQCKPTNLYLHNMPPDLEELEKDNGTCTAKKVRKARRTRLQLRAKKRRLFHMKNNMASAASASSSSSSPREYTTSQQQQQQQQGLCLSHGSITLCGRRRYMKDYVTEATGERYGFFGVYDGHGGAKVAQVCSKRLHMILNEEINGVDVLGLDWERVICDCFAKMEIEINGIGVGGSGEENEYVKSVGSTAVVAVVENQKLVVGNCGDSRAVLCRGGVPVPLSNDHKADRQDELERVEAAGGRVINWDGYRVLGVLAVSRSLGDYHLKPYVISVPEVTVTERNRTDEFLILASDGLWDVMSNELACQIVRGCLYGGGMGRRLKPHLQETGPRGSVAAEAATVLAELALARGSKDNISVVVVELK